MTRSRSWRRYASSRTIPARLIFLAVGAPRQEMVAQALAARRTAIGTGFCVGASLDFLAGVERRAPALVQRAGMEWAWRLAQNPNGYGGATWWTTQRSCGCCGGKREAGAEERTSPPLWIGPTTARLTHALRAALLGIMRSFASPSPELGDYLAALVVFDIVAVVVRLWWWHP